jgi:phospholipid/cholesterol/gamma-HCH transport system permease protein
MTVVDIPAQTFMDNLVSQAKPIDFITGMSKSLVFGMLIGLIACSNGLRVSGGAAGVGRATTQTVVQSIVCIVIADLIFTVLFFVLNLN